MIIGFEAKRVFQNTTGLGNATRGIVQSLLTHFPEHHYHLFAPKHTNLFTPITNEPAQLHGPQTFLAKMLPALWRSKWVCKDMQQQKIDVFIGLAGELPIGIQHTKSKAIVYVHDIIFERYPQQYNPIDVITYRKKTKYACRVANAIAVNSNQTKQDLIDFYNIAPEKIHVVYLNCQPQFYQQHTAQQIADVKATYQLPAQYLLSVGSIIPRKGLLQLCQMLLHTQHAIPLVVIGNGSGPYMDSVHAFIQQHNLQQRVIFLNQHPQAKQAAYRNSTDFPAIYQGAAALIYPSVFEGFGLPILEAMASGVPVITSNCSCMPEVGGDAALYINPLDPLQMASEVDQLLQSSIHSTIIEKGRQQAANFSEVQLAKRLMSLIEKM
jgi:glycosyltransferase involved in cell wall biosynthesis